MPAFRPFLPIFLALACATLGACAPARTDVTRFGLPDGVIARDLAILPQDLAEYAHRAGGDTLLLAGDRQAAEDAVFNQRFFAAWDQGVPRLDKASAYEALVNMDPAQGFAENLRPWDMARWQRLVANSDADGYGTLPLRAAITVVDAPLRRLPGDAPFFLNPDRGGEGYPFDYLQASLLALGTPVAIIHVSRDREWVLVQTSLVSGWTRASNVGLVDVEFIAAWKSSPLMAVVLDGTLISLITEQRDLVTGERKTVRADIGTLLPIGPSVPNAPRGTNPVTLKVPRRLPDGRATVAVGLVSPDAVRIKPLPLTPANLAMVGQSMMGQPYGWGGLHGQRDCSAMTRDLFVPFGVWLPRNSRPQGQLGQPVDLDGLDPDAKERRIMERGVPFFSLVSMPGHVGLYLGAYLVDGRDVPVMFHNIWGLRVEARPGQPDRVGRAVIGKAVVTTLRPGVEHPGISTPAGLLDRISGLAILPPHGGDTAAGEAGR